MGGVCLCCSWTCRPVGPLFILLAAVPVMLHSSQSPAAPVGKVYPRGNHWAVGHLMGKKSVERLPELQEASVPSETAWVRELGRGERFEPLMEALVQPKNQKAMISRRADRLLQPNSNWRRENREELSREMSHLFLLALDLQDNNST